MRYIRGNCYKFGRASKTNACRKKTSIFLCLKMFTFAKNTIMNNNTFLNGFFFAFGFSSNPATEKINNIRSKTLQNGIEMPWLKVSKVISNSFNILKVNYETGK
jgi:hypothetical protein